MSPKDAPEIRALMAEVAALKAEVEEALDGLVTAAGHAKDMQSERDAARAELEEAVERIRDLKGFVDDELGWDEIRVGSRNEPDWETDDAYRLGKVDEFLERHPAPAQKEKQDAD